MAKYCLAVLVLASLHCTTAWNAHINGEDVLVFPGDVESTEVSLESPGSELSRSWLLRMLGTFDRVRSDVSDIAVSVNGALLNDGTFTVVRAESTRSPGLLKSVVFERCMTNLVEATSGVHRPPLFKLVAYFQSIANRMSVLHSKGIAFGNICAQNIWLCPSKASNNRMITPKLANGRFIESTAGHVIQSHFIEHDKNSLQLGSLEMDVFCLGLTLLEAIDPSGFASLNACLHSGSFICFEHISASVLPVNLYALQPELPSASKMFTTKSQYTLNPAMFDIAKLKVEKILQYSVFDILSNAFSGEDIPEVEMFQLDSMLQELSSIGPGPNPVDRLLVVGSSSMGKRRQRSRLGNGPSDNRKLDHDASSKVEKDAKVNTDKEGVDGLKLEEYTQPEDKVATDLPKKEALDMHKDKDSQNLANRDEQEKKDAKEKLEESQKVEEEKKIEEAYEAKVAEEEKAAKLVAEKIEEEENLEKAEKKLEKIDSEMRDQVGKELESKAGVSDVGPGNTAGVSLSPGLAEDSFASTSSIDEELTESETVSKPSDTFVWMALASMVSAGGIAGVLYYYRGTDAFVA